MELEILGINFTCLLTSLSHGEFPQKDCLLPLMSKCLGYCIVAASSIVKVPQIYLIFKHRSIKGLSVPSFELEVIGFTISLAYCLQKDLPFSAYGELLFLLLQALLLVAIIYYHLPRLGPWIVLKSAIYCAIAPTILAGQISPVLFEALYASTHAIFFFARIPQIWENYQNKSTGELSFLTSFMNAGGSLVRLFTGIQEKAPISMIAGSVLGIVLNGILVSQILLYRNRTTRTAKKTN
eukprot:TRINITY_DN304_c0_g1_i1.p1 TRINITY_DN304_c0_g1~~TRINITY_DN304_c0_g1_i1.p1  ORF type:complete len:238 (-),score=29.07 TRINITY_DN304_c0_g1_i1:553-1266(-)